ncbi:hypothetical protein [Brevundimonas sp.]|uniref:hypothetical protein n=1 Tax=Brevundimonas sp. TaxID=1871086 RepID=UPI00286D34F9|nr:hypothetical protein [Brevundimonas sp.]
MTRRRDPFATALESLRSRAEQGLYTPGRPVVILDEARRLNISTTPVREALVWLCGYGLIERAPTGGFLAPRLDTATVKDRFAFRLQCVLNSLSGAGRTQGREQGLNGSDHPDRDLAANLLRAVKSTGSAALVDAYQRVCRQLVQLSSAERRLFRDLDREEDALVSLFADPASDLVEALVAYHQRRIEAAPLLILEAEAERGAMPGVD